MKKPLLLLLVLASSLSLYAQPSGPQLHGIVTQQNSGNTPLDGVQVSGSWASPTASLSDGSFSLTFFDIGPGEGIHVEAEKSGWEVVNEKEMQTHVPKAEQATPFKIVMAPYGQLAESRITYYNISREVITRRYEQQIARLNKQQEGWETERSELEERYQEQLNYARSLAEKFARTNFDDVSDLYEKAFGMYQRGQIDSALQVLEAADLISRTAKRISERENIDSLRRGLNEREAENEAGILEDMEAIELAAELYAINYENEKAVAMYEQLIALDSTNLDNMLSAAEFFRERKYYSKAIFLYEWLNKKPIEIWQKGNNYGFLGELKTEIGQLSEGLQEFYNSREIYLSLFQQDTGNVFFQQNLATSYSKLGDTYASLGQLDSTLQYYTMEYEWFYKLSIRNPQNEHLKNGLAVSCEKLGETHTSFGQLDIALLYYLERFRLGKELVISNPRSESLKNNLAVSYEKLGDTYASLEQLDKALGYYSIEIELFQELMIGNPRSERIKNGLAISYSKLGDTYASLGQLESALWYYRERLRIGKELAISNPGSENLKYGLAISNSRMGTIYTAFGQLDSALWHYKQRSRLGKELSISNPLSESLKNGLAISYEKLGMTYASLGQLDSALWYYRERSRIAKELCLNNPRNMSLLFGLGVSYYNLGSINVEMDQIVLAKENYQVAAVIFTKVFDITGLKKYREMVLEMEEEIEKLE